MILLNKIKENLNLSKPPAPELNKEQKTPRLHLKKKSVNLNKKNLAIILTSGLVVTGLVTGGIMFYKHYENTKPVGIEKKVKTADGFTHNIEAKPTQKLVDVVGGGKLQDRGYDMLWQSRVAPVDNGKQEFKESDTFRDTLLKLLVTENKPDVIQAAALWIRNRLNYSFTNNANLTVAAIGTDAQYINDYFELIDGKKLNERSNVDVEFADKINTKFKSPWTMAFYGASLQPQGTKQLVQDESSTQLDFGGLPITRYSIRQLNAKTVQSDGTQVEYNLGKAVADSSFVGQKFNKAAEAWSATPNINRVYEVQLSNGKRDSIVIVTEDRSGKLQVYGTYYTKVLAGDFIISALNTDSNNSKQKKTTRPKNWQQFKHEVDKYFNN